MPPLASPCFCTRAAPRGQGICGVTQLKARSPQPFLPAAVGRQVIEWSLLLLLLLLALGRKQLLSPCMMYESLVKNLIFHKAPVWYWFPCMILVPKYDFGAHVCSLWWRESLGPSSKWNRSTKKIKEQKVFLHYDFRLKRDPLLLLWWKRVTPQNEIRVWNTDYMDQWFDFPTMIS